MFCHRRWHWCQWRSAGWSPTLPGSSVSVWKIAWPERSWRTEWSGILQLRGEEGERVEGSITHTSRGTHASSLTAVHCRSYSDVASLCVKGELVDVQVTGVDHPNVLFGADRPIIPHICVGVPRGLILLYPETLHKTFSFKLINWINKRQRCSSKSTQTVMSTTHNCEHAQMFPTKTGQGPSTNMTVLSCFTV